MYWNVNFFKKSVYWKRENLVLCQYGMRTSRPYDKWFSLHFNSVIYWLYRKTIWDISFDFAVERIDGAGEWISISKHISFETHLSCDRGVFNLCTIFSLNDLFRTSQWAIIAGKMISLLDKRATTQNYHWYHYYQLDWKEQIRSKQDWKC